jgi:hypothetical protein
VSDRQDNAPDPTPTPDVARGEQPVRETERMNASYRRAAATAPTNILAAAEQERAAIAGKYAKLRGEIAGGELDSFKKFASDFASRFASEASKVGADIVAAQREAEDTLHAARIAALDAEARAGSKSAAIEAEKLRIGPIEKTAEGFIQKKTPAETGVVQRSIAGG